MFITLDTSLTIHSTLIYLVNFSFTNVLILPYLLVHIYYKRDEKTTAGFIYLLNQGWNKVMYIRSFKYFVVVEYQKH